MDEMILCSWYCCWWS